MEHNLFKPKSFEEGRHGVVGDCNGISMEERWKIETPLFAKAIVKNISKRNDGGWALVLDYGCGVGRLAKAVASRDNKISVKGVDSSDEMMAEACKYIGDPYIFQTLKPAEIPKDMKFHVIYCVYVLQHCPAIEIREVLARIHSHLEDDGVFVYCSSDYRMAIRFDGQGFLDDRFLGVNLQEEIGRFFDYKEELFDQAVLDANPVLKIMITGGLPHPAKVYTKKKITDYLHMGIKTQIEDCKHPIKEIYGSSGHPEVKNGWICKDCGLKQETGLQIEADGTIRDTGHWNEMVTLSKEKGESIAKVTKLVLVNRLAPGDVLVMTNAIRDLHKAHPGKYITDVRTTCQEIFQNNPYITKLNYDDGKAQDIVNKFSQKSDPNGNSDMLDDIKIIDMQYPLIHRSGLVGAHFSEGHREYLEQALGVKIPQTEITPEIYLTQDERMWVSPVTVKTGYSGKYWLINAGSKGDYTLKQYPFYQEVVNLLADRIKFVQIGQGVHNHVPLDGALSLVDKTNLRELFRATYFAEGVLTCVSLPMHVAAAFKKPCVVVSGAREGTRWELYPNHQFIYVNGCLPCATYDGCWKSRISDCNNKVNDVPKCMTLIRPEDVVRSILRYYDGGMLT